MDPRAGTVQINGVEESYDLIVGCDGAGAITRRAIATLPGVTLEKDSLPNYCMMIALDQATDSLDPEWPYLMNGHPFTVAGAVNGADKTDPRWFCMVGFNHSHRFGSDGGDPVEEARQYFRRHTDMLRYISDAELARFVERDCHHIGRSVKCSTLHAAKVVLLCDAGCAFPPVGQGINAAMESAIVFAQAVEACGGGATTAQLFQGAERYNLQWKPEADAAQWIATRWAFSNLRMSAKMILAEFLNCNVLTQAKHMAYSEVYEQAQKRIRRLGPLKGLMEP